MRLSELRPIESLKDDCITEGQQTLMNQGQTVRRSDFPLLNWANFGSFTLRAGQFHSMGALARLGFVLHEDGHSKTKNRKQSVCNT